MTRRKGGRIVPSKPKRRRAIKRDKQTIRKLRGLFIGWGRRN